MTSFESIRAENAVKLLSRLRRENPQLFRAVQIWATGGASDSENADVPVQWRIASLRKEGSFDRFDREV